MVISACPAWALAHISHRLSTAAADTGMTTVVPIYTQHKLGALLRAPRRTVEYACGALSRALLAKRRIHARLRRLATKPCEKCGLETVFNEDLSRIPNSELKSEYY